MSNTKLLELLVTFGMEYIFYTWKIKNSFMDLNRYQFQKKFFRLVVYEDFKRSASNYIFKNEIASQLCISCCYANVAFDINLAVSEVINFLAQSLFVKNDAE